mmetsp:Transcript_52934/g.104459  ORF Transcript_52934/g.104459 Transcript_52934/m.104459 type:complete len:210 (-) Transcript_52934:436-1065(-)
MGTSGAAKRERAQLARRTHRSSWSRTPSSSLLNHRHWPKVFPGRAVTVICPTACATCAQLGAIPREARMPLTTASRRGGPGARSRMMRVLHARRHAMQVVQQGRSSAGVSTRPCMRTGNYRSRMMTRATRAAVRMGPVTPVANCCPEDRPCTARARASLACITSTEKTGASMARTACFATSFIRRRESARRRKGKATANRMPPRARLWC